MSAAIVELAEKTPVEELEKIYELETARAKKAVWASKQIDEQIEHRHKHIVREGRKWLSSGQIPSLYIRRRLKSDFKYPFRPSRPGNHGWCTSEKCPLKNKFHLTGLYFHDFVPRGEELWPYSHWVGHSQAPKAFWKAVRRLENESPGSESTRPEDVEMVTEFRNWHYFSLRINEDYDEEVERTLAPWKAKIDAFRATHPAEEAHIQASPPTELGKLIAREVNIHAYAKEPEKEARIHWWFK